MRQPVPLRTAAVPSGLPCTDYQRRAASYQALPRRAVAKRRRLDLDAGTLTIEVTRIVVDGRAIEGSTWWPRRCWPSRRAGPARCHRGRLSSRGRRAGMRRPKIRQIACSGGTSSTTAKALSSGGEADPGLLRLPLRAMAPLSSPLPKDSRSRLRGRDEVINVRHERLGDRRRQHR
jgi:hypothetical protein